MKLVTALMRAIAVVMAAGTATLAHSAVPGRAQQAAAPLTAWVIGGGELMGFDAGSGTVRARIAISPATGWLSPDLLLNRDHTRLYLLGAAPGSTDTAVLGRLSLLDTRTLTVLRTADVPYRLIWKDAGRRIMALSGDGSRLFIYSSDASAAAPGGTPHYWLTVVDARTLKPLGKKISLPGCGPGELASVPGQIVVLCYRGWLSDSQHTPGELRFVDAHRLVVTARIPMSAESYGLVVSPDQRYVYIGGLHVAQIDAVHHRVMRDVDYLRVSETAGTAPFMHAFDVSPDGGQLLIGLRSVDPAGGYALQPYSLPGLRALPPLLVPFAHFVAAPGNRLITFAMLDSPTHDWQVSVLDLPTGQSTPLFTMNGPVLQIASSR